MQYNYVLKKKNVIQVSCRKIANVNKCWDEKHSFIDTFISEMYQHFLMRTFFNKQVRVTSYHASPKYYGTVKTTTSEEKQPQ